MKRVSPFVFAVLAFGFLTAMAWAQVGNKLVAQAATEPASQRVANAPEKILLWEPLRSDKFETYEKIALIANVFVALAGLAYALMLVKQVRERSAGNAADAGDRPGRPRRGQRLSVPAVPRRRRADRGDHRRLSISPPNTTGTPAEISIGRAVAFFVGSIFSATVGFVGMRLATIGNLRVAAAAQHSFGQALQLGYRTGTITGMLTDGLGLLGGSIIFLIYGEHAYEALLGFGFGGTLLALFMRVGGGIYTKAADVGADLVGKLEKGIPEDDPRNAATIADNVGDNVGDCAGMAADIFESYEVTIVAAMILGIASFGHKGVIFPLLVRAIGVIASIISTYSVRAGDKGTAGEAMKSVNRGFVIGSMLSVARLHPAGLRSTCTSMRTISTQYPQAQAGFPLVNGVHSHGRIALLGQLRRRRARYAGRLDLLDRHHPGRGSQQMHRILHRHRIRAGEEPGQELLAPAMPPTSFRALPSATKAPWRP